MEDGLDGAPFAVGKVKAGGECGGGELRVMCRAGGAAMLGDLQCGIARE